jgi:hypothetical protein
MGQTTVLSGLGNVVAIAARQQQPGRCGPTASSPGAPTPRASDRAERAEQRRRHRRGRRAQPGDTASLPTATSTRTPTPPAPHALAPQPPPAPGRHEHRRHRHAHPPPRPRPGDRDPPRLFAPQRRREYPADRARVPSGDPRRDAGCNNRLAGLNFTRLDNAMMAVPPMPPLPSGDDGDVGWACRC